MTDPAKDNKRTIAKFLSRSARLLLTPAKEFAHIASEPETARKVTTAWVIPWVLIMLAANVVRAFIFGDPVEAEINGVPGEMMRLPLKARGARADRATLRDVGRYAFRHGLGHECICPPLAV